MKTLLLQPFVNSKDEINELKNIVNEGLGNRKRGFYIFYKYINDDFDFSIALFR